MPAPLLSVKLPIALTNSNDGRGHSWHRTAKHRKEFAQLLNRLGLQRAPFPGPVAVHVVRILGPRQQLWDSSSGLRGSYKELEDSLVAAGWFLDDSAKWIHETRFLQDATQRHNGPAVLLDIYDALDRFSLSCGSTDLEESKAR